MLTFNQVDNLYHFVHTDNLAPFGCTQYFWKEDSDSDGKGIISSYNWNSGNGYHLANQNQVICIRREEDKKKICYHTLDVNDINISGTWSPRFSQFFFVYFSSASSWLACLLALM